MKKTVAADSLMKTYFKQIKAIPLLSFEEELELSKRIQRGDEAARKRLIEANLRLVVKIAHAYASEDTSLLDIIQEGNLGLIHAAEKYDHAKNVRFCTYANWWIKQSIRRYFVNKQRAIRLPSRKEELFKKIKAEQQELAQDLTRQPTFAEIGENLHLSAAQVEHVLNMTSSVVSLDSECEEGEPTTGIDLWEDYTYNPELEFLRNSSKADARRLLKNLKDKERAIIMCRYRFDVRAPHTLKGISEKMGISPETVRQIELRALKNLRKQAENRDLPRAI
jgi:RNA polymerase primary sigma factor